MTMATALLRRFEAAGITLRTEDGRVKYRGPQFEIDRLLPELKKNKRDLRLALAVREAVEGVAGISAQQFENLLNDDDRQEIADGLIPAVPTLRAYAESFARGIDSGGIAVFGDRAVSA